MVLDKKYYDRREFEATKVEDVLGGEEAWRNVERTGVNCANDRCDGKEAYFKQMQTRSADEPMTSIYKCVECGTQWREG
ncbi:RNA polymerase III C11 subunit [Saxophila tyrrhenica]|uniref:DNA-directed RNA polymerase III subunit RPC10 n=1 Tax=Saxophila tyrrhenica TaxID=1690608 RepID=A0AAV9PK66_9PEZI|nr:RNA polymerase III C11 subunit [Saxophila tyrrhenica]